MDVRKPLLFPDDAQFWFETVRMFGAADYGGSQFGEVLATSQRIRSGDYDSWFEAWSTTADRVEQEAQRQAARGHLVSARDGFLRASNYHRCSEFFLHGDPGDARIAPAYRRSIFCYQAAAALHDPKIEPLEIPYERTTLPGYLHPADPARARGALLVMHTGFDGSAEEMHFMGARAGAERGYDVLVFDGPGQFGPRHREGLTLRPDWEKVITPVVDFALGTLRADPRRIALMGVSLGGLLAPRAAAYEKRLAALIANDGIYDYGAANLASAPPEMLARAEEILTASEAPEVDAMLAQAMRTSPTTRWGLTHGMYALGAPTPRAYLAAALAYTLANGVAEAITCPTLVCAPEGDEFFKGQPEALYAHLTCPRTLMRFSADEGAGGHCQLTASRLAFARIYDWLDDTLG